MSEDGGLHTERGRASSFGDDAEQYDRVRPGYPPDMVDVLMGENPRTVLDVGCGTGIASRLFIERGCDVLGLEPDPRMAEVARRHGLTVEGGTIEGWEPGGRRFDLLIGGQSWHWVEPRAGAAKAAAVLRPGGRIGLFWNMSFPSPEVRELILPAYERHAPELGRQSVLLGLRSDSLYVAIARALEESGGFEGVILQHFEHFMEYSTEDWLELTITHSDHRMLPPHQLSGLLGELRQAIDGGGGRVPVRYETTLVTGLHS
jgi:SAM-dependent methyltransferase